MSPTAIRQLLKQERFVEVVYFGALQLVSCPSAELHLDLGLACCAAIKPIAQFERDLASENETNQSYLGRLMVGRGTRLVNEGLHHLLQATRLDSQIRFPPSLEPITIKVLRDLEDYLGQEFKGFSTSELDYSLRSAGLAAFVLLTRLQELSPESSGVSSDFRIQAADEILAKVSSSSLKQASFYNILP